MQSLPIMEQFYTIQGEGFHRGKAAYFIRLAGCDVGCVWCDVKESWNAKQHSEKTIDEIISEAKKYPSEICVITGGEPTMYDLNELTSSLHSTGKKINLETSGAYSINGKFDWICLSPKKFKAPLEENFSKANELKVIIFNQSDFEFAKKFQTKVSSSSKLYLQPEWSAKEKMLPQIIDYVKENPVWEISIQEHKYINVS